MSEWLDLENVVAIDGYAVNMMSVLNTTGVGRACFLQLFVADTGKELQLLFDPELMGQMAWETTGVISGYADSALGFVEHNDLIDEDSALYDQENEDE